MSQSKKLHDFFILKWIMIFKPFWNWLEIFLNPYKEFMLKSTIMLWKKNQTFKKSRTLNKVTFNFSISCLCSYFAIRKYRGRNIDNIYIFSFSLKICHDWISNQYHYHSLSPINLVNLFFTNKWENLHTLSTFRQQYLCKKLICKRLFWNPSAPVKNFEIIHNMYWEDQPNLPILS